MMSSGVKEFGDVRDREDHTPSLLAMGKQTTRTTGTSRKQRFDCRHSSESCSTVQGTVVVFVNRSLHLASIPTSIEAAKHVSVTTYPLPLRSLKRACFFTLLRCERQLGTRTPKTFTMSN